MWGSDHGWVMNGEGMGFGFIFWLVILAVIIAGVVWFVRSQPAVARAAFPGP
jgi:Na+-transporting methylmalonyl-CoA/oxaloacetate decarboxylase gamma subunit